jgi:hypothetical protein
MPRTFFVSTLRIGTTFKEEDELAGKLFTVALPAGK